MTTSLRILLLLTTLLISSQCFAVTVPLSLKEVAGVTRSGEWVTHGIPLAATDNVTSTAGMKISTDEAGSSAVDAQFKVLSRYDDTPDGTGPIRVVAATFQASVTGSTTGTYYFHTSGGSGTASGDNLITSDASHYLLNTGQMLVKVKKAAGFNLFDQVTVDSTNVVAAPSADGVILVDGYDDTTYASYNSNDAPTITVEYNGPLYACLAVTGNLESSANVALVPKRAEYTGDSPILYTARYHIYKDSRSVKVQFTLKNENRGWGQVGYGNVHSLQVDNLYLRTSLAGLGTPSAVRFGAGFGSGAAFVDDTSPADTYTVYQNHPAHDADSTTADDFQVMSYQVGLASSPTTNTSDRFDSYAQIRDANRGVMVAGRWFWENYWTRINLDATNKRIDYYLLADESFDQMFIGGSHKTWEIIYKFHGNVASDYTFSAELAALKDRLYAVPGNFASSSFLDFIPGNLSSFDPGVTWTNSGATETLRSATYAWNQANKAKFDSSAAQNQVTDTSDLDDLRQARPFTWSAGIYNGNFIQWYGWRDFGGMARYDSYGYSAQHYNWDYLALRTGYLENSPGIIDVGQQLAYAHADIETIHDPQGLPNDNTTSGGITALEVHGGQRYEEDSHLQKGSFINYGGGSANDVGSWAHQWSTGIALQYLMTGEKHFLDALEDIGEKVIFNHSDLLINGYKGGTYHSDQVCYDDDAVVTGCFVGVAESRNYTRAIDSAVQIYKVTGNSDYLSIAEGIFNYAVLENEVGTYGILYYPTAQQWTCDNPADSHLLYDSLMIKGFIDLWYATSGATKTAVGDFLSRLATWATEDFYPNWNDTDFKDPGTYVSTTYWPYTAVNDWGANCEYTTANLTGHIPLPDYSMPFADLFAWKYLQTSDTAWRNLARKVFFDFWAYAGSTKAAENINQETYSQIEVPAFDNTPASAWAKSGMTVEKPSFYLAVESGIVASLPSDIPGWSVQGNFQ